MEYMTLLGAEQVQRAANNMMDAAHRMQNAVSEMGDHLRAQREFMSQWLADFQATISQGKS